MDKLKVLVVGLLILVLAQSLVIASLLTSSQQRTISGTHYSYSYTIEKSFSIPYAEFNQPISNDTEYSLDQGIEGSWVLTVQSKLTASPGRLAGSEAQIAIAPEYPSENLSIPTIIVQERGDGLLRIEYFTQDWPHTYGLVLYNSTSPGWIGGGNVTIKFLSYGPPVPVNPQIAPYPNGNLTITVGNTTVLSNYPIAWSNLSSLYIYGLAGSSFTSGIVYVDIYRIEQGSS